MKLDFLAMAAHPDDVELACAGTLLMQISKGHKAGILDFTRGELGTRGTPELRLIEAQNSADILGLHWRENLGLQDGFVGQSQPEILKVIEAIRATQPEVVLCNAPQDRHPDHGNGAQLAIQACFLSGLVKIETFRNGEKQAPWRPKQVFHYIQDQHIKPDFVVDITPYWEVKMEAVRAFRSQFYFEDQEGPLTYISTPDFWRFLEARAMEFGHGTGAKFVEGFLKSRQMLVTDLLDLSPRTGLV